MFLLTSRAHAKVFSSFLKMLDREKLNSEQGMAGWLLLISFVCLHNTLISTDSIITY